MGEAGRAASGGMVPEAIAAARNGLRRGYVVEAHRVRGAGVWRMAEIQRARILDAIAQVSAEYGVVDVTVAQIVEHAGVSRRTFYELYNDREDCFLAAFDDAIARASRYVLDVYDPGAGWLVRVRAALVALLEFLDAEPVAGRLLIVGSPSVARLRERRDRVLSRMIALVDEGRDAAKKDRGLHALVAQEVVGGVLSVLHARLLAPPPRWSVSDIHEDIDGSGEEDSLLALAGALMSVIVLPYLGPVAARRELERPTPQLRVKRRATAADPLRDVGMRLTYRTIRVLSSVAAYPGSSNREIGQASDIQDQGQVSKLLTRLSKLGLVENTRANESRGAPNQWTLTNKGQEIEQAMSARTGAV